MTNAQVLKINGINVRGLAAEIDTMTNSEINMADVRNFLNQQDYGKYRHSKIKSEKIKKIIEEKFGFKLLT